MPPTVALGWREAWRAHVTTPVAMPRWITLVHWVQRGQRGVGSPLVSSLDVEAWSAFLGGPSFATATCVVPLSSLSPEDDPRLLVSTVRYDLEVIMVEWILGLFGWQK